MDFILYEKKGLINLKVTTPPLSLDHKKKDEDDKQKNRNHCLVRTYITGTSQFRSKGPSKIKISRALPRAIIIYYYYNNNRCIATARGIDRCMGIPTVTAFYPAAISSSS